MKSHFAGVAVAALLMIAASPPSHAEDAAAPKAPAAPPAAPAEAPPPSVARPALAPKTVEPAPPDVADEHVADEPAPHRFRRFGLHHGAYRTPFPIYWPHLHHHRIHWSRRYWTVRF